MKSKVLVLNADYRAISVCSASKAFVLVYMQKAELVSSVKDGFLRTVSRSFPMPSVIRLMRYVKVPYRGVVLSRQNLFKRDNYQCVYCGERNKALLTLDHVIPRSQGGKTSWTNLVTACQRCNSHKGNYSLEKIGMNLPYEPFKPTFVMFLRDFSRIGDDSWQPYLLH
ncbi:MAG: HNH endonuclease [Bernardetiaceae bacterium]|nr:HNH endonuclease [Bernardetiaceae bacterium]